MLNVATVGRIADLYTTVGASTMGWAVGNIVPAEVLPVSQASTSTITLPPIAGSYPTTGSGLGVGNGAQIAIFNAAATTVTVLAAGSDAIVGSTATITQNTSAIFVADSKNARWYRIDG